MTPPDQGVCLLWAVALIPTSGVVDQWEWTRRKETKMPSKRGLGLCAEPHTIVGRCLGVGGGAGQPQWGAAPWQVTLVLLSRACHLHRGDRFIAWCCWQCVHLSTMLLLLMIVVAAARGEGRGRMVAVSQHCEPCVFAVQL